MVGNPIFDALVEALPQAEECYACGWRWPSTFLRYVSYYDLARPGFLSSVPVCMFCMRDADYSAVWMRRKLRLTRQGVWIDSVYEN